MTVNECIFCKIANKEVPVDILFEDDLVAAFKDASPIAPVHVLIVPKEHIESVAKMEKAHEILAGRMVMAAKELAERINIAESGYKLLFRVGRDGGQEVLHVHLHLLGGGLLKEIIELKEK